MKKTIKLISLTLGGVCHNVANQILRSMEFATLWQVRFCARWSLPHCGKLDFALVGVCHNVANQFLRSLELATLWQVRFCARWSLPQCGKSIFALGEVYHNRNRLIININ